MRRPLEQVQFPELAPEAPARLRSLLGASADPDTALHFLERLRQDQAEAFARLTASPAGLRVLVAVFSFSRFLAEAVLAHPGWVDQLLAPGALDRVRSAEEYADQLESFLVRQPPQNPLMLSLALFRRQQVLRIFVRDALGLGTLSEVTEELSNLADAVLEAACRRIREQLVARHGEPRPESGRRQEACAFTVISLGKLGGRELNYSSDIDLMFLYAANGETRGPQRITNKEFFRKLSNQLTELLSTYTAEGMCYRVDLRLRPEGRFGEVCISLAAARNYYRVRARDWELQMLIKARVSAGDRRLGAELLAFVEPLTYSTTTDFSVVESASATRERISEKLAAKRGAAAGWDVKLARGGIRDIEFLVQCLQRLHGGREPWVRHGGTLLALSRLRDKDLLSATEYSRLASAYQFLRHLEHRLQVLEDRQTHVLPPDPVARETLARKMPAAEIGDAPSAESLLGRLNGHLAAVQEIYERVIHAQQLVYYRPGSEQPPCQPEPAPLAEPAVSNLVRFLDQRAPRLAAALTRSPLCRGRVPFEHLLERLLPKAEWLAWLEADPGLAGYLFDLLEHSLYFSEQLIRTPDLLAELRRARQQPGSDARYQELASSFEDAGELRRFFRREMFRIQAESICQASPIFATLERTSELADMAVAAAYRMAVEQVRASHPPASPGYVPADQMMAIALGRLGMREFDLASDADLVFVLPDADLPEQAFWTRAAERMIAIISAYTGDGMMFAVDTRLRPNGREGALVQSEGAFQAYFARAAQAWEGITYMKSRAVAGDLARATKFLSQLQDVDWRRYGQSGRSRPQLAQMRQRLEKEQGAADPLKAGQGGYYDIDFALMYLRLKGAGIFYKVLNTPARIDVVEQMGHLDRSDADFLRDAATFYRAVDHGLRVTTGHAEGSLPTAEAQLETLAALVRRWTPDHLHDQPLEIELAQIQARTREFFDRLFGL
jgi:glutamate-ammonia-ligase adenylyltransferase